MSTGHASRPRFQPANPDFATVVAASFTRQGLMTDIGARLAVIEPGHVVIEVPFSDRLSQQGGFFHGAVMGAIGDSAGGYATLALMPAGSEVVTVEYKINFMRPAAGELLRATGRVLRPGRTATVASIEVEAIAGGQSTLAGVLLATYTRIPV